GKPLASPRGGYRIITLPLTSSKTSNSLRNSNLENLVNTKITIYLCLILLSERLHSDTKKQNKNNQLRKTILSLQMCDKSSPASITNLEGGKIQFQMQNNVSLFERIQLDLIGPIKPQSNNQVNYILTIVNNFSRYIVGFPLQSKLNTTDALINILESKKKKLCYLPNLNHNIPNTTVERNMPTELSLNLLLNFLAEELEKHFYKNIKDRKCLSKELSTQTKGLKGSSAVKTDYFIFHEHRVTEKKKGGYKQNPNIYASFSLSVRNPKNLLAQIAEILLCHIESNSQNWGDKISWELGHGYILPESYHAIEKRKQFSQKGKERETSWLQCDEYTDHKKWKEAIDKEVHSVEDESSSLISRGNSSALYSQNQSISKHQNGSVVLPFSTLKKPYMGSRKCQKISMKPWYFGLSQSALWNKIIFFHVAKKNIPVCKKKKKGFPNWGIIFSLRTFVHSPVSNLSS
ncbi:hypothetical protein VP01_1740g1, partial [Puccinia sorghi]